jgi:hypothetical protein
MQNLSRLRCFVVTVEFEVNFLPLPKITVLSQFINHTPVFTIWRAPGKRIKGIPVVRVSVLERKQVACWVDWNR